MTILRPTPLVIVGAGGLGRETVATVRACNLAVRRSWDLLGFADDNADLGGTEVDGYPVMGSISGLESLLRDIDPAPDVVICTGRPGATTSRRTISRRLEQRGANFATIVHPDASLAPGTTIGAGSILLAQVVTTTPLMIGRQVVVMPQVVFTHDDRIGDFTTFGAGAKLAGGVTVGDGAYIGSGALIREGLTIGAGALVGMGSVVTHDVPADEVWAGNPARPLPARAVPPRERQLVRNGVSR